jgi:archaeal flagellar protein FlaI
MKCLGYLVLETNFSKKISEGDCGAIVKKKDKKLFLLEYPELEDEEKKLFEKIWNELKESKIEIKNCLAIHHFVRDYCIENEIILRKHQREKIFYILELELLGNSILEPLIKSNDFEEIVINGIDKPIILYHKIFGWIESNIYFSSEEKIRGLINKIASPLGRQLSYKTPIINATLENGSRLNASMDPIAFSGINATIRKFKENPITPLNLINYKTISTEAMAFLWLAMQTSSSILVCGNTGSGKTTTLNSLFCFLPKEERIIVVEETPEIFLPQEHKIKLNTAEQVDVNLEKLIENTFRMRPDRVIVGEIRSQEEARAFVNTMLAGQAKGSYATFHAETAEDSLKRLVSFGIEKSALEAIDLIVVQKRITRIDLKNKRRFEERKIVEICEINKENGELKVLFKYNTKNNKLEKNTESFFVKEKIKECFSLNNNSLNNLLNKNTRILNNLNNDISFNEFFEIIESE